MEPALHTSKVTMLRCCFSRLMAGWVISRYWLSKMMKIGFLESSSSLQSPSLRDRCLAGVGRPCQHLGRRLELLLPEAAVAPVLLQVRNGEHHDQTPAPAHVHDEVSRWLCRHRHLKPLMLMPPLCLTPHGSSTHLSWAGWVAHPGRACSHSGSPAVASQ